MARSHHWKGVGSMYLQRRDDDVHYSGRVVIPLLLILAGDIEMNPGPGEYNSLASCYKKLPFFI